MKKFVPVARDLEIPEGESRCYDLDSCGVALCRVGGRLYAIEDVCTHDDGPLGGGPLEGHEVECPRHGARFDVRTGAVTRMPAIAPVRTFPVKVEGGEVFVELDDEYAEVEPVKPIMDLPSARLDLEAIRADFPILSRKIHGHRLVYLDNVATTQKPASVIEAEARYYRETNSNIHRGIYTLAAEATEAYEAAREATAKFIGADSTRGIVFTRGTTESINLTAQVWGRSLQPGDEILVTEMEHHSNLVPWFLVARDRGAVVRHIPVTDDGKLDLSDLDQRLGPKTRIVAVAQVSNMLGTINPVAEIAERAHRHGARVLVDAAQSAPHLMLDVRAIGADAVAFSGHKMLGPTGVGILWMRPELLEQMEPYHGGGEMIREVYVDHATFADIPARFEAGTPNIAGGIVLHSAYRYLERIGREALAAHESDLMDYALDRLQSLGGLRLLGPKSSSERVGALSFADDQVHPHDLATVLDQAGVAIRAGHHCAQPLHRRFGLVASARASFYLYNGRDDVDALIEALRDARKYFG